MSSSTTPSSSTSAGSRNSYFSRGSFSPASSTTTVSNSPPTTQRRGECNCGQETKVVVLIGPTQNGKSSLIKSILEYGGDHEQASTIHIGDGNRSATKEISLYRVQIDLRTHFLRETESASSVNPSEAARDDSDFGSLETYEEPAGKHLHLLMIDTPGLDDSDQQPTNMSDTQSNSNSTTSSEDNAVDTEHKLKVLQAISAHPGIHSVCFVLSRQRTLGATTQRLGREYLEVLQHCNLKPSVHFAHTYVNRDNMFDSGLATRPKKLDEIFNHKFKHQVINNDPDPEDPIEQCLASQALSSLLHGWLAPKLHPCKNLGFPKPRELTLNENQLKDALRALASTAESDKKTVQTKKVNSAAAKKQLEIHLKNLREESSNLKDQINDLDTETLIQIVDESEFEESHFTRHATVSYRRNTDIIIRKREITSNAFTTWSETLPTIGTRSCYVSGRAGMWEDARISVKLWGYKKDQFAKQLESLRTELKQTEESIKRFKQRVNDAEKEIRQISEESEECEDRLRKIRRDQSMMETPLPASSSIPLSTALQHRHLLTGSDTVRIADLYGLKMATPQSKLPGLTWDFNNLKREFTRLENNFDSKMTKTEKTLVAFTKEGIKYQKLLTDIYNASAEQSRLQTRLQQKSVVPAEPPSLQTTDTRQCPFEFEPLREALQHRYGAIVIQAEKVHEVKQSRLQGQPKLMQQLIKDLEGLARINDALVDKWKGLHERYEDMKGAVDSVKNCLKNENLPIGLFTAVKGGWSGNAYDADAAFKEIFDLGRYPCR